ncbi:hypothetical protein [Fibrivirga algicola]|uniref:Uncharacterized protein n=1 Tax=Fibrivirga algicola TaxID=2950420 RepID=A0ABX0QC84_9BACT|nr:hypothetical protein [Fibrivirga algicola]NID09970.1 hypothetical protein [Fibrivirga algicola]
MATLELNATDEGTRKLKQLSGLYQDGTLKGARTASFTKLYAAFVAEQSRNANIRQFRRETAEKIMAQSADMSLTDKAYYTNELITYRSDDVKLIGKSITALKDKLPAESHAQMVAKAQQLFDQYEAHFQKERIEYSRKQGETYQERAIYALNRVWAEQGMAVVRESRQLL